MLGKYVYASFVNNVMVYVYVGLACSVWSKPGGLKSVKGR